MSTQIGQVFGKLEIPKPEEMKSNYVDNELYLTSFYGGTERGKCLQLTLSQGTFIQMNSIQIDELIRLLQLWKNNNY